MEHRKKNLLLAVEDGGVSMNDVKARMDELNAEISTLESEITRLSLPQLKVPPVGEWNLEEFRKGLMVS